LLLLTCLLQHNIKDRNKNTDAGNLKKKVHPEEIHIYYTLFAAK
jgi:hypothetical protein